MAESPTTSIFARDSMANPVIQPGRCRHQQQPQQEDDDEESSSSYSTIMLNHHVLPRQINTYKTIYDLPSEVLVLSFMFLGIGHFRCIGGTSRTFRELYLYMCCRGETGTGTGTGTSRRTMGAAADDDNSSSKRTTTSIENIVSSISCVELYREETGNLPSKLIAILNGAAAYGQLKILEWAHQQQCQHQCQQQHAFPLHSCSKDTSPTDYAVKYGQLVAMIWLLDHGFDISMRRICRIAAENGHLNILTWLNGNDIGFEHMHRYRWWETTDVCSYAAKGGHFHVLKWARENRGTVRWDSVTCANAAEKGRLDILQWLRERGCPWDGVTCANAAGGGHLAIIQWARENGCVWDKWSCSNAARGGHIDTLKWLRKNGCPWDLNTYYEAENGEHAGVWNYVKENYRHRF